jgi:hypothetical protein
MSRLTRLFAAATVAIAGLLPLSSLAAPVYTNVANQNYWTNVSTGQDYLDLTQTLNNSYATVFARTSIGGDLAGWRLATNVESRALYNSFAVSMNGWNSNNEAAAHLFFDLFGVASDWQSAWNGGAVNNYLNWNAIFDADQKVAHVALMPGQGWFDSNYAFSNTTLANYSGTPQAALLVRAASSNAVPEPESLALFGIALAGLVAARKRKQT